MALVEYNPVKREQNPLYYDLIKEFHKQTECPNYIQHII